MKPIEQQTFLTLATSEVAALVRAQGPQVCVFPINGTRRWFMLEHAEKLKQAGNQFFEIYLSTAIQRHVELCGLMFDHGIDTLLTPVFGSELLTRGDEYTKKVGIDGLVSTANFPAFLDLFEKYQVRVQFYGDYQKYLADTPFAYALDALKEVTELTKNNTRFRMFFGVFADDSVETVAELSIRHFQKNGNIPSRRELVEHYYGDYIEPASMFIGFDKFNVFDYPLLNTGSEDLYFSVSPSPYMTMQQLRSILYDHLFERKIDEPDYTSLSSTSMDELRNYYRTHQDIALGTGIIKQGLWTPKLSFGTGAQ